jgi:hypothetical protein
MLELKIVEAEAKLRENQSGKENLRTQSSIEDNNASTVKAASFVQFSKLPFDSSSSSSSESDSHHDPRKPYVQHVPKRVPVWKQPHIDLPDKSYYLKQFKRN